MDIKSKIDIFLKTRIKLTVLYTLIIIVILGAFGGALYFSFRNYLLGDFEDDFIKIEESNLKSSEPEGLATEQSSQSSIKSEKENEDGSGGNEHPILISNAVSKLGKNILIIDGAIIVLSAFASFWLSGRTLQPISKTHQSLKNFLADTSHDLRTPLSIMKTGIEIQLRDRQTPGLCRPVLSSNLEETDKMIRIVDDLLLMSRLENEQELFKFEKVELNSLLKQIIDNIEAYGHDKKIVIDLSSNNVKLELAADSNKLNRAFYNIIKNSIDYSNENGKIKINLEKKDKKIQIDFIDNGVGIPKEYLPHIFDRFYRINSIESSNIRGSGLGLAITNEIIKKHKGNIQISSVAGEGTRISISLLAT